MVTDWPDCGWRRIGWDARLAAWAKAALPVAEAVIAGSPEPWRCGGTWFVGVDALPNDADGAVGGVAFPWAALPLAPEPLHRAQLSVIRPGYPQPSAEETPSAFRYRLTRDGAHLDGVLAVGPDKRRMIKEPHGWIMGLPLNDSDASPLVVWEGSHLVMQARLLAALRDDPVETWGEVDITDAYKTARTQVFQTCRRVALSVRPGEATLIHRLAVHGVAPWTSEASDRIVAYFRPQMASVADWLCRP